MNKMSKTLSIGILTLLFTLFMSGRVEAVCPICTAAAAAGFGIAGWLGVSDLIPAIWMGALLSSASLWFINWITKKGVQFKGLREIVFVAFYATMIFVLHILGMLGVVGNTIFGIDKIIFGIIIGTIIFIGTTMHYEAFKKKRGKALFPFQKVVVPAATLIITSLVFYFLTI